ncbi:MAG: DUF1549 domain-containing protein [Pirellulales bacterium]
MVIPLAGGRGFNVSAAESTVPTALSSEATAAAIDELFAESWAANAITPAAVADDAELVRRTYLDLAGRIPSVHEVRAYLATDDPDKHRRLVDELVSGPEFAAHLASQWREILLPGAVNELRLRASVPQFEAWLRLRFAANTPYDRIVRDLLTATSADSPPIMFTPNVIGRPTPLVFYLAAEQKPEELAAAASRAFLGLRLECAQCHDHPFADWKQEDFWATAAFFRNGEASADEAPAPGSITLAEDFSRAAIEILDTGRSAEPRFLDGSTPAWQAGRGNRTTFADWLTDEANVYFARAAANRLWAQLLGKGLIEPVDSLDQGEALAPSGVLTLLAEQLKAHDLDLQFLVRTITATRVYHLSSAAAETNDPGTATTDAPTIDAQTTEAPASDADAPSPQQFSRYLVRSMSAEQLYESLLQATGIPLSSEDPSDFNLTSVGPRAEFIRQFSIDASRRDGAEMSILHALSLMNGSLVAGATDLDNSYTLVSVAEAPFLDAEQRISTLFLATLSRPPSDDELAHFGTYVAARSGEPGSDDNPAAYGDVLWALINSAEFALLH